ncbi:MAG: phage DNA encapsidation protein [Ruminococcus sp.]|nr:phage DNA encapsidation protein [Ruminococcus sp.]
MSDYYSYKKIDELHAKFNLVISRYCTGKTYGMMKKILDVYIETGMSSAYVRRLAEDLQPRHINFLFNSIRDYIEEKTHGKYNDVFYQSRAFYLIKNEILSDGSTKCISKDSKPFCRTYDINTSTPIIEVYKLRYIMFDEFMSCRGYLSNECKKFRQLCLNIKNNDDVQIYMLGNSIDKYCPYFKDMGLKDVADMEQGTINLQTVNLDNFGKTTIAVDFC